MSRTSARRGVRALVRGRSKINFRGVKKTASIGPIRPPRHVRERLTPPRSTRKVLCQKRKRAHVRFTPIDRTRETRGPRARRPRSRRALVRGTPLVSRTPLGRSSRCRGSRTSARGGASAPGHASENGVLDRCDPTARRRRDPHHLTKSTGGDPSLTQLSSAVSRWVGMTIDLDPPASIVARSSLREQAERGSAEGRAISLRESRSRAPVGLSGDGAEDLIDRSLGREARPGREKMSPVWMTDPSHSQRRSIVARPALREQTECRSVLEGVALNHSRAARARGPREISQRHQRRNA
jgi:hypothetical protein